MPELESIEEQAFRGLNNLSVITITHNPKLEVIHPLAFLDDKEMSHIEQVRNLFNISFK